jgi:peptide/nickel transport system substrate-binding protein
MKKQTIWLYLAVSAFCLLSGFHVRAVAGVDVIRIADSKGDWGLPNPFHHYPRGPGYVRMSWVFDTLIWKDHSGYVPALAQSWSFDKTALAFTFHLNPKAKWHDGKPVTATDVVFTIAYFKKHPYGWITLDDVDRVEARSPHEVVAHLSKPYAPFLSDIGGTMPILPEHIWRKVENPQTYNQPNAFIGSGPYRFSDFNKTQGTYLFKAYETYYQGRPKADKLIYFHSTKPFPSLLSRQADLANIQPEMAPLLRQKGLAIIEDERGWNKKLMINHKRFPFSEDRFRQALAFVIDRREIIDKSHRGFGVPASYGLLSIDHEMYNPDTPVYDYNPEKARSLIEALGYRRDTDGWFQKNNAPLKIQIFCSNITVSGQSVTDRDGEILKKQLEQIGIEIELINMEQTTIDNKILNWDFDLALTGHGGINGDARILNEMISSYHGAGSVNSTRYDDDPELNRLLEAQMMEMDPDRRKIIVYRIQEIYAEILPAISLYYPVSLSAYNPEKGITWFYTKGGISKGIPIAQNKMSLIQ